MFEAIEAAGGFLEQADEQWLNQAATLTDGEKILVYTKEETEAFKAQGNNFQKRRLPNRNQQRQKRRQKAR